MMLALSDLSSCTFGEGFCLHCLKQLSCEMSLFQNRSAIAVVKPAAGWIIHGNSEAVLNPVPSARLPTISFPFREKRTLKAGFSWRNRCAAE